VATYVTQAELSARVGGDGQLALIASTKGTLDAAAVNAITNAITDVSADIDARIAGLGVDVVSSIPAKLKAIAIPLVIAMLFKRIWQIVPAAYATEAEQASADLEELQAGDFTVNGATPAKQNVSQVFVYLPGDTLSDGNPRRATRDVLDKF
jgi:hypothetical protein